MAECNICGWSGKQWRRHGKRYARCCRCDSFERHRVIFYALERIDPLPGKCVLSNPHPTMIKHLKDRHKVEVLRYRGMGRGDLCMLPYDDASIDMLIHAHVLEHIRNDLKALKEIKRVLEPFGWTVSVVPVRGNDTVEHGCPAGAHGHWRMYGLMDYVALQQRAGFRRVEYLMRCKDNADEWDRYNLGTDPVFFSSPIHREGKD